MFAMLFWIIIGFYGLAVAAVHLAYNWQQHRGGKRAPWMHVILVTENDERHIERMIRAYCWFAWLKGCKLHFTVVDSGSTDATFRIAARAADGAGVSWRILNIQRNRLKELLNELEQRKAREEILTIIEPCRKEDWGKIPFLARSVL